jgi:ribose transport system permease protein
MSITSEAEPTGAPHRSATPAKVLRVVRRNLGVGSTFLLLIVFFGITEPTFLTPDNVANVLRSSTILLLAALGMMVVMLGGGFDLSIGSMAALAGVVLTGQLTLGFPPLVAAVVTLVICFALGSLVNGTLVGILNFNFFVVTLATLSIFRGAAQLLSGGLSVSTFEWPLIQQIGDGDVIGLPIPVLLTAVVYAVAFFVLRQFKAGRMLYAVGGNAEAARLSGISVTKVRMWMYGVSGLCAGMAGIILTGRLTSSQPVTGAVGLELTAAAAVLLGGTSFAGGSGSVVGTVIGCLYLGVLQNGLSLAGVPTFWQTVATGVILLIALAFSRLRAKDQQ